MSRTMHAGAAALVAAPAVAIAGIVVQPTLSDDAADQLSALTDHRAATIASIALSAIAIVLLIAGIIWLVVAIGPGATRVATAGGVLGVFGALVVLFENGIAAAAPSAVHGLDPATATALLDRVNSSAAVSILEPLSLLGDVGLALLGLAVVSAGAQRLVAASIAAGAFGQGVGFATGTKVLVVASFAILLFGLARAVQTLIRNQVPFAQPPRQRAPATRPAAMYPAVASETDASHKR